MNPVPDQRQLVAPGRRRRGDHGEAGASMVEYALLVGLIAFVCIAAVVFLSRSTSG